MSSRFITGNGWKGGREWGQSGHAVDNLAAPPTVGGWVPAGCPALLVSARHNTSPCKDKVFPPIDTSKFCKRLMKSGFSFDIVHGSYHFSKSGIGVNPWVK